MGDIFFYGCLVSTGHHLYDASCNKPNINPTPWPDRDLDPQAQIMFQRSPALDAWMGDEAQTEGAAVLSYRNGWTRLGWPDRSVDDRRGSHANLLAKGQFTIDEMLAKGKIAFPWLFKRIKYTICLKRTVSGATSA